MIHLLLGENSFEIERRLRELVAAFSGEVERVDGSEIGLERLPDLLLGTTLFSTERLVVIKGASENKPVWDALGNWAERGIASDLILIDPKPDKRTKAYKTLQKIATVIEANEWTDRERVRAEKWLREYATSKSVTLQNEQVTKMVVRATVPSQRPGSFTISQQMLASAIDALAGTELVTDDMLEAVLPETTQDTVFSILHTAISGDAQRLMPLITNLRASSDPYMTLGFVMSQWSLLVSIALTNKPANEIASTIGAHPFVVQNLWTDSRQIKLVDVTKFTHQLATLDDRLKTTATDPWDGLTNWLMAVASR